MPVHWNWTVSPFLMLSDVGPNYICGPTLTVFVAANAGTAMAAATTRDRHEDGDEALHAGVEPPVSVGRST